MSEEKALTLKQEKMFNAEAMMTYKWLNVSAGYKYLKWQTGLPYGFTDP